MERSTNRRLCSKEEYSRWNVRGISNRGSCPNRCRCNSPYHQPTAPSTIAEKCEYRHPREALPRTRVAGHLREEEASDSERRRASQVLFHSMRVRHLPQQMDLATLAILPFVRGESCGCRSLAQDIATGARQQGQNQKCDECSVFSRDPFGSGRTPDVLTPEEIMALLKKLPEPLRTGAELDAFTGLQRGQLIGLQWADVDFENLVIHFRRSVVMMVQGDPKTEASAKDVPLDAALAESLLKLRLTSPYNRETDWVFASPPMKGKQPLCRTLSGDDTGNRRSRRQRSRSGLRFTRSGTRVQPC